MYMQFNIYRYYRAPELIFYHFFQNNLERTEFETKTQLTLRIETLDKENTVLRRQLDGSEGQNRTFISTIEVCITH